jgi:SagB-type dehydrogenase family enzyme
VVALGVLLSFITYYRIVNLSNNSNFKEGTSSSNVIPLPDPETKGSMSVEESLTKRRSIRDYTGEPLSVKDISQLLWAAQGITEHRWGLRAAPSAGGTYPLEVYVVIGEQGVPGLEAGIYQYKPYAHSIMKTRSGDLREALSDAALEQIWVSTAPVNIVISAVYERTTHRYGERGIRYVHMEVGHAAENIYLQATALHLGVVVIGAFHDEQVHTLLSLPEDEKPLYIIPVGHPA